MFYTDLKALQALLKALSKKITIISNVLAFRIILYISFRIVMKQLLERWDLVGHAVPLKELTNSK